MQSAKQSLEQSLSTIKKNTSDVLDLIDSKIQAASSGGLLFIEVKLDFSDRHTVITTLTELGYKVSIVSKRTGGNSQRDDCIESYLFIGWDIV